MPQSEIKALTSVRWLAASIVLMYHYPESFSQFCPPALKFIGTYGFLGVNIFFALSGFILTLRYYDEMAERRFDLSSYVRRRIARIYPLYFTILTIALLLTKQWPNIQNLTLTQGYFAHYIITGLPTAWSLTVEESFYILFPLILFSVSLWRRPIILLLVLVTWVMIILCIGIGLHSIVRESGLQAQGGFLGDARTQNLFLFIYTIFGRLFDFCIGIYLALVYVRGLRLSPVKSTILSIVGVAGIVGSQWILTHIPKYSPGELIFFYVVAFFASLFIFSLTCENAPLSRLLSLAPFVFLGRISFALYLIQHTPILEFMRLWTFPLLYTGANIIGAVFYKAVEEPARRVIMQFKLWLQASPPIKVSEKT